MKVESQKCAKTKHKDYALFFSFRIYYLHLFFFINNLKFKGIFEKVNGIINDNV